jgi:ferric-dicitrate binding protein FerR (iron transport regulator)
MNDLEYILGNNNNKLADDRLLAYLEGRSSSEEQHEIERWLADEGMESDAIEGLKKITASETEELVNNINQRFRKTLTHKNRKRKQIKDNWWATVAIIVILFLIVLGYIVMRMIVKK